MGIQFEKIMEIFFVIIVNYIKKFDDKEYQYEISFDRFIIVFFVFDGFCFLYDVFGCNFDQQILEESKFLCYMVIKILLLVFYVFIQWF